MGFKCGIVGLPNVGKSTVFNALTKAKVAAANYPFCTIDPNVGVVPVPDGRLNKLAEMVHPQKIIPAVVEFVDIAGLVKGAAQGEGLGNKFLANIRETQAIAHVVRCFHNDDVIHVAGRVDPRTDVEVINTELVLADLESVERALDKASKNAKSGNKESIHEVAVFTKARELLNSGASIRSVDWGDDHKILQRLTLLTAKPVLYIANVDEECLKTPNQALIQLQEMAASEGAAVIPICATIEAELAELAPEEREEFLQELGMSEPGLDRVVHAGYHLLGLQTFFTAGAQEARAWTIPCGAKAPAAAGVIHTDFERGFICAEVIAIDDYFKYQGEHGAKEAGKLRLEGKDYVMQDGDVVHFRFNV